DGSDGDHENLGFPKQHGEPLNEPVVKQGSFVMTNKTELLLAYGEYKNGKFGREEAIM
ncbi:MAG: hypothetical protein KHY11_08465, partial [Veillonella sp.]|nr:hypothetical protein [Veillonella sp.]